LLFNVSCVFNRLRTTTTIAVPPPKYGPLMDQYTWMNLCYEFDHMDEITWACMEMNIIYWWVCYPFTNRPSFLPK
jgi:hypothetical protein